MADFLTVNLNTILKNQKSFDDYTAAATATQKSDTKQTTQRDLHNVSDWAKELKDRLAENQALEASERISDYEVEAQFFRDYFTHGETWGGNYTDELLGLGEPLKKAIKVLGFDKNVNPILGFITDNYVLISLLQTKLLNANTFKAIYNAVSKELIAHSELFTANDYNIVYCQDLYRRPLVEIMKYLTIQKNVLSPTASTYTANDLIENKKIFFKLTGIGELETIKKQYTEGSPERLKRLTAAIEALPANTKLPSATNTATKLNELELINFLISGAGSNIDDEGTEAKPKESNTTAGALARKIGNNNAQAFAAIQYLSATTDVPEATKALKHEAFKNVSMETLIGATAPVTKLMKNAALQTSDIKTFIKILLDQLERNT